MGFLSYGLQLENCNPDFDLQVMDLRKGLTLLVPTGVCPGASAAAHYCVQRALTLCLSIKVDMSVYLFHAHLLCSKCALHPQ